MFKERPKKEKIIKWTKRLLANIFSREFLVLIIAFVSLCVSWDSNQISRNVREMITPNGYYHVTVFSTRNITGTKHHLVNHFSVDILYYGSVPSNHIVFPLSVKDYLDECAIIESNPLIDYINEDVIIVYNCPIEVNLRVLFEVNGTIDLHTNVRVLDVYTDCKAIVRHDNEKPIVISTKNLVNHHINSPARKSEFNMLWKIY